MRTQPKLLLAGVVSLMLLGVAGARIQAGLSARTSRNSAPAANVGETPDSRHQALGEQMLARRFDIGAGRIEIEMADADVILEATSGSTVEVRVYVDASDMEWAEEVFEDMDFRVSQRGNTVHIQAGDPDFDWERHRSFSVTTVVSVPEGMDVDVETDDGDVQAESLSGNTSLRSSDGDIQVDVARGGDLEIHTSDGDILVDRLESGHAEIRTSDGDIVLRSVRASIEVSSGDGDIRINLLSAHQTTVSTGDGDVTLSLPEDIEADVHLQGEDLNVAQGLELVGRIRRRSVEGTLNGGGPLIEMMTGDGTISLRRGN